VADLAVLDPPTLRPALSLNWLERLRSQAPGIAALALVIAAALGVAAITYHQFLSVDRYLWWSSSHDRNAHYLYGLQLAIDVHELKPARLLFDVNGARAWPPVNGVILAPVLLVGGFDYRIAVFPSLACWIGTAVLAFLMARRALGPGGNLAGLVAALFVLASPSHRAFATDIMLESGGACLSLAVLYLYLLALQVNRPWCGRCLGLALTVLFYQKYNYWALVAAALLVAELTTRPRAYANALFQPVARLNWRGWCRSQIRHPLTYVLGLLAAALAGIAVAAREPVTFRGRTISLYPPHTLLNVAYAVLFVRLLPWWWRHGRAWCRTLDPRWRQVVLWHFVPVAFGFLLPKRLGFFLAYCSPGNTNTERFPVADVARIYWDAAVGEYHMSLASALAAVVLLAAGFAACRRLRPGAWGVLCFVLISTLLTLSHPNCKPRFLCSWIPAAWVVSGIGLGAVSQLPRGRWLGPALGAAAVGGLWLAHLPGLHGSGAQPRTEGGPAPYYASLLDLSDAYLPSLDRSQRATILASFSFHYLAEWTFVERYGSLDRLENHWLGFGPAGDANREAFRAWLRTTDCDTIVFLESTPGHETIETFTTEYVFLRPLRQELATQTIFRLESRREMPQHGCVITVWRRP
jgi:hypothetical protein